MGHLSYEERAVIEQYRFVDGLGIREIGRRIGRDHSVVSRELHRNGSKTVRYKCCTVQRRSKSGLKKRQNGLRKVDTVLLESFCDYVWTSKATISQACHIFGKSGIYPRGSRMYQLIREDRGKGGSLWNVLDNPGAMSGFPRCKKGKRKIEDGRKGIEERPFDADSTEEYGHWEVDTVHSRGHSGGVVTAVVQQSLLYIALKVDDLRAETVCKILADALSAHKVLTVTSDNGSEFAGWKGVEEKLNCGFYFARPYRSNDRARNERMNRELRRFFPKGADFKDIPEEKLRQAVQNINAVPRRKLGWISSTNAMKKAA